MKIIKYAGEDPNHLQHLYPTPSLAGILAEPNQKRRLEWCAENTIGDRILDVGTCSGYVLYYVPGKVKVGLDNSEVRLKLASYEFGDGIKWVLGDATNLPFLDKEFDTVLVTETLEHLTFEDAKKSLKECDRVGKRVVITVPCSSSGISKNHEHLWECSLDSMSELLSPYNYSIKASSCSNFWLVIVEGKK